MKVDYDALGRAASGLSSAAAAVSSEPGVPAELVSGASGPNGEHSDSAADRSSTLGRIDEVMRAQSTSCREMVALFQLLDAQIASQVASR